MGAVKNALIEILECKLCYGKGYTGWANDEGDYEFEWCECNPYQFDVSEWSN